jgi:hypothetical protein
MSAFLTAIFAIALWELGKSIHAETYNFVAEWNDNAPATLTIEVDMAQVEVGKPFKFYVAVRNASGRVLDSTGVTVTTDNGAVVADPFVNVIPTAATYLLTAATEGAATLNATDGKIAALAVAVPVLDNTPATLEIVIPA